MNVRVSFEMMLRGVPVLVECDLNPPDRGEGIHCWWVDKVVVFDQDGNRVNLNLTTSELAGMISLACEAEEECCWEKVAGTFEKAMRNDGMGLFLANVVNNKSKTIH